MKQSLLIKVCGMTQGDNIRRAESLGIDLMGFVFYPKSPRCLSQLPGYLPRRARRVGVFVDETKENVAIYADRFGLDYLQLHGHESPDYCRTLRRRGFRLIKAFQIAGPQDLTATAEYDDNLCDYFLFDTKTPGYGGSGNQFDWTLLQAYRGRTPFLLSGGISAYSAPAVRDFRHPALAGVDLNSRFETEPGLKDIARLQQFINELKKA